MKILKLSLLLITLVILQSCIRIIGEGSSFRGLYSYYDKEKKANPNLFVENSKEICTIKNNGLVYLINGENLKACLASEKKAIVYIWTPNCHSSICIALNTLQEMCIKKNVDLFIIAEYFDSSYMKKKYDIKRPIFGIDTNYYKSNLTDKYRSRFVKDLTEKEEITGRYLYFEKGRLSQSYESSEFINFIQ